jgi:hypothetical protein
VPNETSRSIEPRIIDYMYQLKLGFWQVALIYLIKVSTYVMARNQNYFKDKTELKPIKLLFSIWSGLTELY